MSGSANVQTISCTLTFANWHHLWGFASRYSWMCKCCRLAWALWYFGSVSCWPLVWPLVFSPKMLGFCIACCLQAMHRPSEFAGVSKSISEVCWQSISRECFIPDSDRNFLGSCRRIGRHCWDCCQGFLQLVLFCCQGWNPCRFQKLWTGTVPQSDSLKNSEGAPAGVSRHSYSVGFGE